MIYLRKFFLFVLLFLSVLGNQVVFGQPFNACDSFAAKQNHLTNEEYRHIIDSLQASCAQLKSQLEQKNAPEQNKKIINGIIFFLLVDLAGLFFFFYLEQKRAYVTLVKKNMEWASQVDIGEKIIAQMGGKTLATNENACVECENLDAYMGQLTEKDHKLLGDFIRLIHTEKMFLKPELSLTDVAKKLSVHKITLSKLINVHFGKSFPALLNEYRIREAIFLLTDKSTLLYTMEAISEMCGYSNRQVFHTTFKKATGLTPSNFRKMSQNKDF